MTIPPTVQQKLQDMLDEGMPHTFVQDCENIALLMQAETAREICDEINEHIPTIARQFRARYGITETQP